MKKWLCFLAAVLTVGLLTLSAFAADFAVIDRENLLSEAETARLEKKLEQISDKHKIDMVVLTVASLDGKSAMDYADDYYDDNGYGDDGVLLLVCVDEGEWWISTAGKCISKLDAESFEEDLVSHLRAGEYYEAFVGFAQTCDGKLSAGKAIAIIVCIAIGLVVGLVTVLVMMSKMKTVRAQRGADSYVEGGDLQLTHQSDIFLYQTVTRRPKPQNNGGGSHIGSSGRRHGGGGGRF